MKKPMAILFSLLLVWAQMAFSGLNSTSSAQAEACTCCDCGGSGCCLAQSPAGDSIPLTVPSARTILQKEVPPSATTFLTWTLPAACSQASLSSTYGPLKSAGVPLFTRHCALLI